MTQTRLLKTLAVIVVCLASCSLAQAQATRTWVSGVGDDVNPCSRTAPCKTFAGAISKTANCGEISALDPAGFGAVNITKSITINGDGTLAGPATVHGAWMPGQCVVTLRHLITTCTDHWHRYLGGRHLNGDCTIHFCYPGSTDQAGRRWRTAVPNTSISKSPRSE